ncbi:MAG TPA: methyltransferase domain-containing protein [Nitrospira sp.]|nr:methyltransferase domain-containing protein [Nitrospira sp.]
MSSSLVNIGCGATWHPAWTNLDVRPVSAQVRAWDVSHGLPFANEQVDACYASHVLEHLTREQAHALLIECLRVLRPGGIVRLAVPDLEGIVREYLDVVTRADKGEEAAIDQYEWITLELLDQLVRDKSGGEMERYLRSKAVNNAAYVVGRIGPEAMNYMTVKSGSNGSSSSLGVASMMCAVARSVRSATSRVSSSLRGLLTEADGQEDALRVGHFRLSGECHRWMYDRFSLKQLLERCGFSRVRRCSAFESGIAGFASFGLDVVDGKVRKPDSLFMEAMKP